MSTQHAEEDGPELSAESVVIRGGQTPFRRRTLLMAAERVHEVDKARWGLCVGVHPIATHEVISANWRWKGQTYRPASVAQIEAHGFTITRDDDYHGVLWLPREPAGVDDDLWDEVEAAFLPAVFDNPIFTED